MRHRFYSSLSIIFIVLPLISFFLVNAAENYERITPDNVAQLTEVQRLGNGYMNDALAWSPDGNLIAIGGKRGLWFYASLDNEPVFHEITVSGKPFNVESVLFAPDGNLVLLSNGEQLIAYEIEQRSIRYIIEGFRVLAISDSQVWFAYEVASGVRVAEIETGNSVYDLSYISKEIWGEESQTNFGRHYGITHAQFMPKDQSLIVGWEVFHKGYGGGGYHSEFDIWSLDTPGPVRTSFEDAYGFAVDFAYVTSDGTLLMLNRGEIIRSESAIALEYDSPFMMDGDMNDSYIAGSYWYEMEESNSQSTQIMTGIWNIDTGKQILRTAETGRRVFSPDNSKIAIGHSIYDIATGERLAILQSDVYFVLSQANRLLLYGTDNTVRLLDASSLAEIAVLPILRNEMHWHSLYGETLLFKSKDYRRMVSVSVLTGELIATFENENPDLIGVEFNSDARYLLTFTYGFDSRNILLWDAKTGEQIVLPDYELLTTYFTDDDELILWHPDSSSVVFYDVSTQTVTRSFFVATDDDYSPQAIGYFPPYYVAIATTDTMHIYDLQSGKQVKTLDITSLNTDPFNSPIIFQPEYQYLAYQTWRENIEIISLPDATHVGTIDLSDGHNSYLLGFSSSSIIKGFSSSSFFYYDIEAGEYVEPPEQEPTLLAETELLRFFRADTILQIEDLEGNVIKQIDIGQSYGLRLSNDKTRLFVDYSDGTMGIRAVTGE